MALKLIPPLRRRGLRLLFPIAVLLVSAVRLAWPTSPRPVPELDARVMAREQMVAHTSADGTVSIRVPVDLVEAPITAFRQSAASRAQPGGLEKVQLALHSELRRTTILVMNEPADPAISLYQATTIMRDNFPGKPVTPVEEITLAGRPAYRVHVSSSDFFGDLFVTRTRKNFHVFVAETVYADAVRYWLQTAQFRDD
jgi:hypothetical protein